MANEKQSIKEFFISYNGADKVWAEWIAWQLEEAGFSIILQAWDFRPGANFVLKMQEASEKAKRTIAVLSPNYLRAHFTQPEWAAAFRRDPQGTMGILVPVMVQDCSQDLAGLWPQIIYINLVGLSEQAARNAVLEGMNRGRNKPNTPPVFPGAIQHNEAEEPNFPGRKGDVSSAKFSEEKPTLPKAKLNKTFNPYKIRDEWIEYITLNLREAIEGEDFLDFYAEDVEGNRQIRILSNQKTIYALDIHKGAMGRGRDEGINFAFATGRIMSSGRMNAWGYFKWSTERELVVLELQDLSLLSSFNSGDKKLYTKEEFLHALWNKIRSVIENSLSYMLPVNSCGIDIVFCGLASIHKPIPRW
jgi:TIR domain